MHADYRRRYDEYAASYKVAARQIGEDTPVKVRVPLDDDYTALVGKAVYVFSYYEWTIIYIIEALSPVFVSEYSREHSLTSGAVCRRLRKLVDDGAKPETSDAGELETCLDEFSSLIPRRNALIHAHPITNQSDGAQILNFQGPTSRLVSDMKWDSAAIRTFIEDLDQAAIRAGVLLQKLRSRTVTPGE